MCVENGGPSGLGLHKCGECGGACMKVSDTSGSTFSPISHLNCHRVAIIFRDCKVKGLVEARCPHCKKTKVLGVLTFVF